MEQLKSGPQEPLIMPGPKFGESGGWFKRFKNWFGRNSSNIVLTIIGLLIVVGGIYLYSNYHKANAPISADSLEGITQQQNQQGNITPEQIQISQPSAATSSSTSSTSKAEIVSQESGKITVKADKGAGVTHLARQALKQYLNSHSDIKSQITPEHKIYIEDYLKDKTGSFPLKIGQQLTFDENLIKEAIDNSQKLNQKQLQNLHKYVLSVPSLSP